jgi:uncharacterized protein YjbI with pentapeptide repeats
MPGAQSPGRVASMQPLGTSKNKKGHHPNTPPLWEISRAQHCQAKRYSWAMKNMTGQELLAAYAAGERDFIGVDLIGVDLNGAILEGANLMEANLSGANLSGAKLMDANLIMAKLMDANLMDANLSGAQLFGANLSGADLSEANLEGVIR